MKTTENKMTTTTIIETESALTQKRQDQMCNLGLRIAFYRKKIGMSQLELAEKAQISRTYMSNIEAPNRFPNTTLEIILNIADALEIPVSKLFEETDLS